MKHVTGQWYKEKAEQLEKLRGQLIIMGNYGKKPFERRFLVDRKTGLIVK